MAETSPSFSIIIPAHNEEYALPACLAGALAAARATGEAFEVIVVDDASTDRTAELGRAAGAQVVPVNRRQIAAVRNAGAQAARGAVLVFVDADTVLPAETLAAALVAVRKGAVGGGARVRFDADVGLTLRALMAGFSVFYFGIMRWAAGCFVFARREAYAVVGGFDERYYCSEEVVLSKALKRQGRFVILRQSVVTSGRKARQNGLGRLLWIALRVALRGPKGMQRREGLELWYDGRREGAEAKQR